MSRKDGVVLASRTLAVLLTVWGLTEVSVLPEILNSFVHYLNLQPSPTSNVEYLRHDYLIITGFRHHQNRRLLSDGGLAFQMWTRSGGISSARSPEIRPAIGDQPSSLY
jgi:hypothetical protein